MNNEKSLDEIIKICEDYEEVRRTNIYTFGSVNDLIEVCYKLKALGLNWGDKLIPCKDFRVVKKYYLTNSATKFIPEKDKYYVEWDNGNIGRLQFTTQAYYNLVTDEWHEFEAKLMSYNPVDYDPLNNHMVFEVKDGKRLMHDYFDICREYQEKVNEKIKSKRIEIKRQEIKKLQRELDSLASEGEEK